MENKILDADGAKNMLLHKIDRLEAAANQSAKLTIIISATLNGGGIAAVFLFLSTVISDQTTIDNGLVLYNQLIRSLLFLIWGAVAAALSGGTYYLANRLYLYSSYKKLSQHGGSEKGHGRSDWASWAGHIFITATTLLLLLSLALFVKEMTNMEAVLDNTGPMFLEKA